MSVPVGLDDQGLPIGLQFMAPAMADDRLYVAGGALGPPSAGGGPAMRFEQAISEFDPVLGLEVHVELNTETKMFCGCSTTFGAAPNTQVCPVCLAPPGSLPVVNGKAVESAIRIGLALNCAIAPRSRFARKNYFYPDMPKNYQISQYDEPIAVNGYLDVDVDGDTYRIGIERAPIWRRTPASPCTWVARPGASTAPTTRWSTTTGRGSADRDRHQAHRGYRRKGTRGRTRLRGRASRDILRSLGVSDVRMEQGSLRCDANVSLRPDPQGPFGTRTETKNVNSLRSVERAVPTRSSARRCPARRRNHRAGDPALARGHRQDHTGADQGRGRGLSVLPGAGPAPVAASEQWWSSCARRCLSRPPSAGHGCNSTGVSPTSRCVMWSMHKH